MTSGKLVCVVRDLLTMKFILAFGLLVVSLKDLYWGFRIKAKMIFTLLLVPWPS